MLPLSENNPFYNMAVDEAILLSHAQKKTPPTLRFYTWNPASISIGYFQKISEKEKNEWELLNIPFVRRLSGGRAVYHNHDLTYSFIISDDFNLLPGNISESCQIIGKCLYYGLKSFGLSKKLLEINSKKKIKKDLSKSNCFNIFSQGEVLYNDRKLIGSAQVRKKGVILQHGSILINNLPEWGDKRNKIYTMITLNEILGRQIEFEEVVPFIVSGFKKVFNIEFSMGQLTEDEKKLAANLECKYKNGSV